MSQICHSWGSIPAEVKAQVKEVKGHMYNTVHCRMVHSGKTVEAKLMALRREELSIGWYTHTIGFYTNFKENELELVHMISTKY